DPHRSLTTEYPYVSVHRARHPEAVRLFQAFRKHGIRDDHGWPSKIPDRQVEVSYDVLENRLALFVYNWVHRRIEMLRRYACEPGKALDMKLATMGEELRRSRLNADFLDDVSLLRHPLRTPTMVLLHVPAYRYVLSLYLEMSRRMAVQILEPLLEAPLDNLP